ncbi:hypothetical protein [Bradyrhizobium japonicum]|nr:hypothetical protein [Bradyrhizobium japonicum]WLB24038.1 hypothetical protein QIH95_49740 [Bradyrhizobium japonicum]
MAHQATAGFDDDLTRRHKSSAERPRDPADIALDKKIKSICRGC